MKNVLILAYHFPPLASIGAQRPFRLAKHLPEFGWRSTILTVSNDMNYTIDDTTTLETLKHTRIVRVPRLPINRLLRRPGRKIFGSYSIWYSHIDEYHDWYPVAFCKGKSILDKEKFDAIFATAPPYTTLRLARSLKKKSGLPTIADLRDPFTQSRYARMPTSFHQRYYSNYERQLLQSVDKITAAWPKIVEWNSKAFGINRSKFKVITNGYESEDLEKRYRLTSKSDIFQIGFFGSIYGGRSAEPLFQALQIAYDERPDFREKSKVVFAGRFNRQIIGQMARKYKVTKNLEILSFMTREEALSKMSECQALIMFAGMVSENYPGKMFDYMASGRPIISFSKPGSLSKLIEDTSIGLSVDGTNPKNGADVLLEWFNRFREGQRIFNLDPNKIQPFESRHLVSEFVDVLESIL